MSFCFGIACNAPTLMLGASQPPAPSNPVQSDFTAWWDGNEFFSGLGIFDRLTLFTNAFYHYGGQPANNDEPPTSPLGSLSSLRFRSSPLEYERYDEASGNLSNFSTGFEIGAWFKLHDFSQDAHIFNRGNYTGTDRCFRIIANSTTNQIQLGVGNNAGDNWIDTAISGFGTISVDTWYFLRFGYTASNWFIGINTYFQDLTSVTDFRNGTSDIYMNGSNVGGTDTNHSDISYDSWYCVDGAYFNAAQAAWLYNSGNGRKWEDVPA